jgi:nucleotide-binding universal stress UspA family protein
MSDFETIVCGIDGSPQSAEGPRQATALSADDATIWGVAVWNPALAMHAGIHAGDVVDDLREEAHVNVRRAAEEFPGLRPMVIRGAEVAGLIAAASNLEADLLAVGSHGTSRPAGIVFGSTASGVVHHAPCSVLVARPSGPEAGQRTILHADDGSACARDAARVASSIAKRLDATVTTLHVGTDWEATERFGAGASELITESGAEAVVRRESGSAHRGIVTVAAELDPVLIVIGSRGMTGLKALGSVSERVAHRAPCSVLIARQTVHPVEESIGQ